MGESFLGCIFITLKKCWSLIGSKVVLCLIGLETVTGEKKKKFHPALITAHSELP